MDPSALRSTSAHVVVDADLLEGDHIALDGDTEHHLRRVLRLRDGETVGVTDGAGRWRVPDPKDAGDLEALRTRALLREFQEYAESRGRLREVRTEAVRAGFSHCWHERTYGTIVAVAERLPRNVLEEDADLLMYYDNASLMVE